MVVDGWRQHQRSTMLAAQWLALMTAVDGEGSVGRVTMETAALAFDCRGGVTVVAVVATTGDGGEQCGNGCSLDLTYFI
jgi:hypothetical protein